MATTEDPVTSGYLHVDFSAHENFMPDQTQTLTTFDNTFVADGTNDLVFKPGTIVNSGELVVGNTFTVNDNSLTFNDNLKFEFNPLDGTKSHGSPSCDFCEDGYGYFNVGEKTICGVCIARESLESTQLLGIIGDLLLLVTSDREDEDLLEEARDALRKVDIREHIKRAVA